MGIEWQRDWGEQVSCHTPDLQGRSHRLQLIASHQAQGNAVYRVKSKALLFQRHFCL